MAKDGSGPLASKEKELRGEEVMFRSDVDNSQKVEQKSESKSADVSEESGLSTKPSSAKSDSEEDVLVVVGEAVGGLESGSRAWASSCAVSAAMEDLGG